MPTANHSKVPGVVLRSVVLASSVPAPLEYVATARGTHSLAKSVGLEPLANLRLPSALGRHVYFLPELVQCFSGLFYEPLANRIGHKCGATLSSKDPCRQALNEPFGLVRRSSA